MNLIIYFLCCKNSVLVGQNVRMTVDCTDCTKPRCIYSKIKADTKGDERPKAVA